MNCVVLRYQTADLPDFTKNTSALISTDTVKLTLHLLAFARKFLVLRDCDAMNTVEAVFAKKFACLTHYGGLRFKCETKTKPAASVNSSDSLE